MRGIHVFYEDNDMKWYNNNNNGGPVAHTLGSDGLDVSLERNRVGENHGALGQERTLARLADIAGVEIEHLVGENAGDTHGHQEGEQTHPANSYTYIGIQISFSL